MISTWLLVHIISDRQFQPTDLPSAACDHMLRVMCWLQLEFRREIYIESIRRPTAGVLPVYQSCGIIKSEGWENQEHEEVFGHCLNFVMAGMESVAADIFEACNLSHLIAGLDANRLPRLNLHFIDGKDFYRQCLNDDLMPDLGSSSSRLTISVRHIAKLQHRRDSEGSTQDKLVQTPAEADALDWSCFLKAEAASRRSTPTCLTERPHVSRSKARI